MNTQASKAPETQRQSVPGRRSQNENGEQAAFQFPDRRPGAIQMRRLQDMANNSLQAQRSGSFSEMANSGPQTRQLRAFQALSTLNQGAVAQRLKIAGANQDASAIQGLIATAASQLGITLEKKNQGTLIAKMLKDGTDCKDDAAALAHVKTAMSGYAAALNASKAADAEGDNTEQAAASIIGGQINRSKLNGKDVEWRFINRTTAEELKALVDIELGSSTDQELFENWDKVIRTTNGTHKSVDLRAILSTPPDAFSDDTIALAGGLAKFKSGTTALTDTAANRVNQLKSLAGMLNYRPILVFSKAVTCEMCDDVAGTYGVDVEHLE